MEAYSSSSSTSALQEARGGLKVPGPFHESLHSVRKPLAKPWKKPIIAPLPPAPPKVYRVDPINFRDLVQKLTGAPEFMSQSHLQSSSSSQLHHQRPHQRLQRVAPSPLHVAASPLSAAEVSAPSHLLSDHRKTQNQKFSDNAIGLNLSPSSYNWCAFPILSPGTLSSLEQSTVP
ncbi:hypothetical protein DITRI_Ditri16bG0046900 [Diplodiscus trichospermus]